MQSSPSADGSALGSDAGPAVSLRDLEFSWTRSTPVLNIERFEVARGERLFLKGPSGSGKSTLLSLISGVIGASPGSCLVLGKDLGRLSTSRRDALRAEQIGVIFQMFNLVPYLSVLDNVLLPLTFSAARSAPCVRPAIPSDRKPSDCWRVSALEMKRSTRANRPR